MLRYDYVDLSQLIPKKDSFSESKISRPKPESSPPLDIAVFTLRSDLAWYCVGAEVRLRSRLGMLHAGYRPMREGYGLDAAVRFLSPRVDELAAMPAMADLISGVEYLMAFSDLHRRARKVCGLDPRTISVPGDCPKCLTPTLRRHDDNPDRIWCARCPTVMTKQGYYAATRMQYAPSQPAP